MPSLVYDKQGNIVDSGPPPDLSSGGDTSVIQNKIKNSASHYGLDPNLALAVANQESSFNPNAVNSKELSGGDHATGVFQLTAPTAKSYGLESGDRFDPDKNIDAGVHYLADLYKKHGGDKAKTLIEYNSGPKNTEKNFEDLPSETQGYLTNILGPNTKSQNAPLTYDKNGNITSGGGNASLDVTKSPFAPKQATPGQTSAYQRSAQTFQGPGEVASKAATYAPLALGIAGGAIGAPLGAPNVGAGIGSALGEIVAGSAEHGVPNEEDLKRAIEGGVSSYLTGKIFNLPGKLQRSLTKGIMDKAEKSADILEGARQDITGGIPSGPTQGAQDVLRAKLAPVKEAETAQWEKVNQRMDKASHVFDVPNGTEDTGVIDPATGKSITRPKFNQVTVRGPVKIGQDTQDYINSTKEQLQDAVSKFASPSLVKAYRTLDQATKAVVTDKNGDTYLPFDAAKQLRTDIGAITAQESKLNLQAPNKSIGLQRGGAVLTGLRDKLGNDIESTLTEMGPDALKEYGDAVGLTKSRIKANLFDKVVSRNTDQSSGMLNVDKTINDFKNPTSPYSKEFSSTERNNIVQALQAVRNTSPQYDGALKQSGGNWIFRSAYAAAHPIKFAVSITSKDMFDKLLSQPKYARIVAQLPSAPAKSSQAQMLTKTLLRGLQNAPAEMIAPSGMRIKDAHIDENGNPTPNYQAPSSPK